MAKCGCANSQCMCNLQSTESVNVGGFGTSSEPFVLNLIPPLQAVDTPTLDLNLSQIGAGEMQLTATPTRPALVQKFTANGVWTNPGGLEAVRVMIVAGGGGGGGGAYWVSADGSNWAYGGGGGASGCVTNLILYGAEIPANATIVVGAGGAGGGSGNTGLAGSPGSDSKFGSLLAKGGGGGAGGGKGALVTGAVAGGTVPANGGTVLGEPGLSTPQGGFPAGMDPTEVRRLAPGHGGGGTAVSNTTFSGSRRGGWCVPGSGRTQLRTTPWQPAPPESPASAPGDGINNLVTLMGSGGAGGYFGVRGGNGGLYGGGGGGGGAGSINSYGSSSGGRGADGVVLVIAW